MATAKTMKWNAVMLICALPVPALAQSREGIVLPETTRRTVAASQIAAKNGDPDRDSLRNGAIIGAIVLGTGCAFICGQGVDTNGQHAGAVAMSAGFGALMGAAVDAGQRRGHGVIFRWRF